MRWLDGITDSMHMSLSKFQELVMDKEAWHARAAPISSLIMNCKPHYQHLLAAVSEPVNRLSSTCQQLYQHPQGNQSLSRELRASALCPGLEARFPARRREERGCVPTEGGIRGSLLHAVPVP